MDIGRTTSDQVSKGIAITDKNALEKGDLVLFKNTYTDAIFTHTYGASHVGIYAGNGMFIHNSSSAKTVIMSKLSDSYYVEHWLMGRRVLQDSPISGSQSPTVSRPWGGVNLTIGSKGEDVRAIQEKVGTTADGIFGMQTENAVRIWQGTHGLNNNGIVDATTWSKMFADYSGGGGNTTGTFREVPSSALDRVLGGELRNCGSTFIAAGRHYNVDPVLIAAISMHETGNGTSNLCVKYGNVGGITNGSGFRHYPSVISGIYDMASVLWSGYISKGLKTITDIQRKYAPVGAGNDPTNLNSNWISGVTRFYNMIIV
jgi:hypothetical protein